MQKVGGMQHTVCFFEIQIQKWPFKNACRFYSVEKSFKVFFLISSALKCKRIDILDMAL